MKNYLKTLEEKQNDLNTFIKTEGGKAIKEIFDSFFESNNEIEAVRWEQYTPHFNDGEPCIFDVSYVYVRFKGEEEFKTTRDFIGTQNSYDDAVNKLEDVLREDAVLNVLKTLYGDGVEVTATREAIEITNDSVDYN